MRFEKAIPQAGGKIRYVYECPRGTIIIEESEIRALSTGPTKRDIREARALHRDIVAQKREEYRMRW